MVKINKKYLIMKNFFKGTSNYTRFTCFRVVRMLKSRLGDPFNPLQSYVFPFYLTSFLLIFIEGSYVCMYVCMYQQVVLFSFCSR